MNWAMSSEATWCWWQESATTPQAQNPVEVAEAITAFVASLDG